MLVTEHTAMIRPDKNPFEMICKQVRELGHGMGIHAVRKSETERGRESGGRGQGGLPEKVLCEQSGS